MSREFRGRLTRIAVALLALICLPTLLSAADAPGLPPDPAASLPQLAPGDSVGHALGLSAATNLRDLGGYQTGDGRTVNHGLLYRSDVFAPMSAEDLAKLKRLGLKSDYDLRTTAEIAKQPDQIPQGVEYIHLDVLADAGDAAPARLGELLHDPKKASQEFAGGKIEALMADGYRQFVSLPSAQKSYRELFASLANEKNLPAVFHCKTGKDRTGWASAVLLMLLGVPKDAVMADYLRTNDYLLPYYASSIDRFVAAGGDRDTPVAIFGVKPGYLDAALDEMQRRYGDVEKYFSEGLGIGLERQRALKQLYLRERE